VYLQFGYAIGERLKSSPGYRDLVNGVLDALVEGTSARAVQAILSACCDVPFAGGDETVGYVADDGRSLWVNTDKAAYRFDRAAAPVVAAGDAVRAGDPLTDAVTVFDFNRGPPRTGCGRWPPAAGCCRPGSSAS
jgi:hypothetical protein